MRDTRYVEWQLNATVDKNFYQQKLEWALATIQPGVFDTGWLGFELGADTLIGFLFSDSRPTKDTDIPQVLHQAAEQGLWLTHTAHNHGWTGHLRKYWPEVKYINVHGDTWAQRWMNIKNHELPWQPWQHSPGAYEFDLDATIDSPGDFLLAMQELYEWLDWDDFAQTPVAEYYQAYKLAHDQQPKV